MYRAVVTGHLGKPEEVVGDGGGAALDLHEWNLIFSCQQDVVLVVEHGCQVHAPNEEEINRLPRFCAASMHYFYIPETFLTLTYVHTHICP